MNGEKTCQRYSSTNSAATLLPHLTHHPFTCRPIRQSFADVLWKSIDEEQCEPSGDQVQYVLDGGALLHRIPWPRGSTYDSVCQMYVRYVTQKYGAAYCC